MTYESALFRPDDGEAPAVGTVTPPVEPGMWGQFAGWLDSIPALVWLALAAVLFVALLVMRYRLNKARNANPTPNKDGSNPLGGLFYASVAVSVILWAGVLIGSAKNLIGWGRDTLNWTGGWEYLVPATLDGVAIAFAVLMFAAVRGGRSANRAARVVWVATAVSATIGFSHEYDRTIASTFAAMYLAFLALGAMAILHELLDLFRSHTEKKTARISPVFGLRWVTYLPNTLCAWLAWQNHPPRPLPATPTDDQIVWYGSVRHAVAHLEMVRRAKRIARFKVNVQTGTLPAPWWSVVAPWARVQQLDNVLSARDEEMAEMSARLAQVVADFETEKQQRTDTAERLRQAVAEKTAAENRAAAALRQAEETRTAVEAEMARLRQQATETVHRAESLADRQVTTARTELAQAQARLDRLEGQWIEARQEAAVIAEQLSAARSETTAARLSAQEAERTAAALRGTLSEVSEKHRAELSETVARLQAETAETVARIRAEMSTVKLSDYRNGEARKGRTGQRGGLSAKTGGASNRPRMSDEEALQALLRAHPEPEWQWSQPQIRDITGAGGERLQRLQSAIAEHHRSAAAGNGRRALTGEAGSPSVNGAGRRSESGSGASGGDLSDDDKEDSRGLAAALTG
ncbi:DUF2637 domain-containing protein [Micromonospora sp. WMMD1102]|uniref:DUF2637 domain-containing protein n=1 Tax=Micromonospora sp. WMMD1102 TaxID=3016105 RepID=UPI0024156DF2|nr:DUF2637 domain-containing protein [Micromonospora sp. WMMD1102]MDG4792040.1 DUF2637 domain-containing protein [Micromonospora sp. WMMD1102]